MKKLSILTIVLACLMSAFGAAQLSNKPADGTSPKALKQGKKGENKEMREAGHDIAVAVRKLKNALPIYDGHRANAIREAKAAGYEVALGIVTHNIQQSNAKSQGKGEQDTVDSKTARKKYMDAQIAASQKRIQEAIDSLNKAKGELQAAPHDYQGHRAAAVGFVDKAISEATVALGLHSAAVRP
jgi:CHAD domain-containing protein